MGAPSDASSSECVTFLNLVSLTERSQGCQIYFWPSYTGGLLQGFLIPIQRFELLTDTRDHLPITPFRLISDCFPREITLFDIIYISRTGGPHIPSPSFISLISLNSVYHICVPTSLNLHQNVDDCNSLNLFCLLSDVVDVFPRAIRIGCNHKRRIGATKKL